MSKSHKAPRFQRSGWLDVWLFEFLILSGPRRKFALIMSSLLTIVGLVRIVGQFISIGSFDSWGLFDQTLFIVLAFLGVYAVGSFAYSLLSATEFDLAERSEEVSELLVNLSGVAAEGDYEVRQVPWLKDCFVFSRLVDQRLWSDQEYMLVERNNNASYRDILKSIRDERETYTAILRSKKRQSVREKKMFHNEPKICLSSDFEPNTTEVEFFNGSYFLSFLTNELCSRDIYPSKGPRRRRILSGINAFPFVGVGDKPKKPPVLLSIRDARLSNHIGGNVLGITSDGTLKLWFQGASAQFSNSLLAPTGSGSLDKDDLRKSISVRNCKKNQWSLTETVKAGMTRELLEESHKSGGAMSLDDVTYIRIVGYFRWGGRGGLPGFLGVARVSRKDSEMFPNESEVYLREGSAASQRDSFPASNPQELLDSVAILLGDHQKRLSLPLYANLVALQRALKEDESLAKELFA